MYLDSAYIAKYYVNELDSSRIRSLIQKADSLVSSMWALGEVHCVFHRHMREGGLTPSQFRALSKAFLEHAESGVWSFIPVTETLLKRACSRIASAPPGIFLRTGDAIHLMTASDSGEKEVWTNDRHMLAAAAHFGLIGRSA